MKTTKGIPPEKQATPAPAARVTHEKKDVRLDLTGVLADEIGASSGITSADWRRIEGDLEQVSGEIDTLRRAGKLEPLDLPYRTSDLSAIREAATACRGAENFVVLGIGGSALGARAIHEGCLPLHHNLLPAAERRGPRMFFAENVDPESLDSLLRVAPPEKSIYNVVSKSGSTIETITQFLAVWDRLMRQVGDHAAEHVIVTTDPERGLLRRLARERGLPSLPVPEGVGGRFSVLTAVGLFPAAVAGLAPEELLDGAARMDERCRSRVWKENPALALAAVHYLMDRSKGKGIAVMMPYSDAMRAFADWFCQLWAESLGKRATPTGERRAPVGQTPIRAVGATDQHSQLQLYVEGPNDKLFTLIAVGSPRAQIRTPAHPLPELADADLAHLADHDLGEILALERTATELVLASEERPTLVVDVPEISADALGQLFYLYEWGTIAAGMLYHVNPFDQPGVEEGKRLTHAAMGQAGQAALGERVRSHGARTDRYRI